MKNGNSINSGCSHEEKRKLQSPTVPEETFSVCMFCVGFFFRNSWCSQVKWCSVIFSREIPFCYFINHETASFLIICFCSSVSYFFSFFFFSLFFLLSFFFKVFFFSFHLLLFFVLVFPCVSNAARVVDKDLVQDEALCSVALNQNKKFCLTEDAQSRFLGNCLPNPPLKNR